VLFRCSYLNFIRGVVDSDDLPLNVSREQLQQHKILKVMGKKLVRKVLEMIRKLATDQKKAIAEAEKAEGKADGEKAAEEAEKDVEEKAEGAGEEGGLRKDAATAYTKFWETFGKNIKLGVIEDAPNRSKLAKLLRFRSSKGAKAEWRSLEEYVAGMGKEQKAIYYIAGESYEAVSTSPFLERLKAKGLEVLFMTDPIDEYAVQNMPEFDGHRLQSITKEGLTLPGDSDKAEKKREEIYREEFKPLGEWLKKVFGERVEKVVVSNRLASRCVMSFACRWEGLRPSVAGFAAIRLSNVAAACGAVSLSPPPRASPTLSPSSAPHPPLTPLQPVRARDVPVRLLREPGAHHEGAGLRRPLPRPVHAVQEDDGDQPAPPSRGGAQGARRRRPRGRVR
jgi:HSP90 family molecular chaperone